MASASLAQVHLACLHSGEQVVVKVLRPGVCAQVEMDLRVIAWLLNGLKQFPRLRQAFDVERVLDEFTSVSRRELDLRTEGKNAERFAHDFAADPQVYIPKVYWDYSGQQTLTLEDVSYLKISAVEAIEAAGIDRRQVAHHLASIFLRQIFITQFIHADPHPGNLFIKPLPYPAEPGRGVAPNEPVPCQAGRPFQIVLIDFGMATAIPAQPWLREFVIGLGLRDAHRIVQSYITGGLLRSGANPQRVEQMTAVLLAHYPELLIGLMPDWQQMQASHFLTEYADLVENYPFQIPLDLLFMYRALGLVGSVVKQLDPDFELSTAAAPLARQLLWQEWRRDWQVRWQAVVTLGQLLATPPLQPEQVVEQVQKVFHTPDTVQQWVTALWPAPTAQTDPNATQRQMIHQLEKSVKQLTWIVVAVCLLMASGLWHIRALLISALQTGASLDFVVVGLMMLALVFLLRGLSDPK